MNYSEEQLRRKAHLENGGTLANYDRSHYDKKGIRINKGDKNDKSKTYNSNRGN